MVDRVNGGIRQGVWVEQEVVFITLTFSGDISSGDLDSDFDIPNSVLEHAVELVAARATVLAIGPLYNGGTQVDLMLGHAAGHGADDLDNTYTDGAGYDAAEEIYLAGFNAATGVTVSGLDSAGVAVAAPTVTAHFAQFSGLDLGNPSFNLSAGTLAGTDAELAPDADGLARPYGYGHPQD